MRPGPYFMFKRRGRIRPGRVRGPSEAQGLVGRVTKRGPGRGECPPDARTPKNGTLVQWQGEREGGGESGRGEGGGGRGEGVGCKAARGERAGGGWRAVGAGKAARGGRAVGPLEARAWERGAVISHKLVECGVPGRRGRGSLPQSGDRFRHGEEERGCGAWEEHGMPREAEPASLAPPRAAAKRITRGQSPPS